MKFDPILIYNFKTSLNFDFNFLSKFLQKTD